MGGEPRGNGSPSAAGHRSGHWLADTGPARRYGERMSPHTLLQEYAMPAPAPQPLPPIDTPPLEQPPAPVWAPEPPQGDPPPGPAEAPVQDPPPHF